jgi:copper transport protein
MTQFRLERRGISRLLPLLLIASVAFALRPSEVGAHAELAQSDPPAQSSVTRAPPQVTLLFTEPVESRSIEVSVLDRERQRVDAGDAALQPGTQDTVLVSVGDLPAGLYTISWKVTSTVDGHTTRGLVPFSVGDPGAVPEPLSAEEIGAATSEESDVQTGPVGVAARWLMLLSMLALGGLFVSGPLFLRPAIEQLAAMRDGDRDAAVTADAPGRVCRLALAQVSRLAWLALALFAVGSLGLLLVDAAAFAGVSLAGAVGEPVGDWLGTRRGVLWLVRGALTHVLAMMLALPRYRPSEPERVLRWWIAAALVAGMLGATSLGSHSAALEGSTGLPTAIDWIHQLAVATWVGGLIFLAFAFLPALAPLTGPARTRLLATLVPRFSSIALVSVGVIVLTGAYQTWQLLDGWGALRELNWGKALVTKLALVLGLLALGAVNFLLIRPRLASYAGRHDRPTRERAAALRLTFRRVVLAEAALGVLIVLVVGVLTGTSPSQAGADTPDGPFRPFILDASAEGLNGRLVLSPGRIGNNRFDLSVSRADGQPLAADTSAVLRIFTLDQDTGISEARMDALGGGRFTTTGSYLSTVGLWEVAAVIRRPGADDVTLPFRLSLTEATGRPQVQEQRPAAPLARGREIYQNNCIQCHGTGGRGDGPLAPGLRPPPLDLTVHVPLHPDQDIVAFISNGVPRTAMPAFGGQFTPEEIQAVTNYLRELAKQSRQDR